MRLLTRPIAAVPLGALIVALAAWIRQAPSPVSFTRITTGPAVTDRASTGGASWADYDNDGDPDLMVTNGYDVSRAGTPTQPDRLYRNDGGGRLVPLPDWPAPGDSAFSSGSTWGDMDNDGDLDVYISSQRNRPGLLFRNDGGRLVRIIDQPPATDRLNAFASSWVDLDDDGVLDLFVFTGGLSGPALNAAYRGLGGGRFERITGLPLDTDSAASGGGVWGDMDDDGDVDLFVPTRREAGRLTTNLLYRNDGAGRLTRLDEGPWRRFAIAGSGAAWGDYDNDGDLDLVVTGDNGTAGLLLRNDGRGGFARVEGTPPSLDAGGDSTAPLWADFDNDGDLDLLVVKWGAAPVLHTNRGDGTFGVAPLGVHGDLGRTINYKSAVASADYDGDGDLDVYISHWPVEQGAPEENQLYRNDGPGGNWLRVRLEGTRSNRSAIGARITARASIGGRAVTQLREVQAQTTWRSQNELTQHLGLGAARQVELLTIRWPSGAIESCRNLSARQTIVVTEGRGWSTWADARAGRITGSCTP